MEQLTKAIYDLIEEQKEVAASISESNNEAYKKNMLAKLDAIYNIIAIDSKNGKNIRAVFDKAYSSIGTDEKDFANSKASGGLIQELSLLEELLYEIRSIKKHNEDIHRDFYNENLEQAKPKAGVSQPSVTSTAIRGPEEPPMTKAKPEPELPFGVPEEDKETEKPGLLDKIAESNIEIKSLVQSLPSQVVSSIKDYKTSTELQKYIEKDNSTSKSEKEVLQKIYKEVLKNEIYASSSSESSNTNNNTSSISKELDNSSYIRELYKIENNTALKDTYKEKVLSNDIHSYSDYRSDSSSIIKDNRSIHDRGTTIENNSVAGTPTNMPVIDVPRSSNDTKTYNNTSDKSTVDRTVELRTKDAIPNNISLSLKSERSLENLADVLQAMPGQIAAAVSTAIVEGLSNIVSSNAPVQVSNRYPYPSVDKSYKS